MAAARAGDPEAQLEMGILYEYGFFLSENKAPALAWYSLAAEQGNAKAAKLRDKLQASMSPAEIQQAGELKPTLSTAPAPQPAPQPAPESETAPAVSPEASTLPTEEK
jgi:TPR repeat protein